MAEMTDAGWQSNQLGALLGQKKDIVGNVTIIKKKRRKAAGVKFDLLGTLGIGSFRHTIAFLVSPQNELLLRFLLTF